ncbi:hypothetical protein ABIB50_005150 [Mucilaginibacter sp. UYCu711]
MHPIICLRNTMNLSDILPERADVQVKTAERAGITPLIEINSISR